MTVHDRARDRDTAPTYAEPHAPREHPLLDAFRASFRDAAYYSTGRTWSDYAPAYRHGLAAQARSQGRRFEEVEAELAAAWPRSAEASRMAWAEARGAVADAWKQAEAIVATRGLVPGSAVRSADADVGQAAGELDRGGA